MKTAILFLFFTAALLPSAARSENGCPKGQEACSASAKKASGFMKAVEAAQKTAAPAAAEQKAVPAKPPEEPVLSSRNAADETRQEGAQSGFSKPAWLLFVGGGLAALYYYLKEGKPKRGKK